jgi:hypothetical protein
MFPSMTGRREQTCMAIRAEILAALAAGDRPRLDAICRKLHCSRAAGAAVHREMIAAGLIEDRLLKVNPGGAKIDIAPRVAALRAAKLDMMKRENRQILSDEELRRVLPD